MPDDIQDWNRRIVSEFRSNAGFVRWSTEKDLAEGRPIPPPLPSFDPRQSVPIILVNHIGAVTGRRRTSPLMYQAVRDAFAVFATFGGSPRPPAWYHNIVRNPEVVVEVGSDVTGAIARVVQGEEREDIWVEQARLVPAFADFEKTARRRIPVVVLDPIPSPAAMRAHGAS
ncbi:nitroreductase family deazaflavin-dependent oxidoreductase [Actinoalloteichus sp. AHMU CJ021]|uniref:Deazaflavin-dependent oxidoreductase, nitroreductase family n=1 Tax=Actinoalloteichus caeruleus DSM 43889 TaxID=1120930 RepID=A0ABT1JCM3_ACTCY|nr:nitroreductase/quinone reductase family protein [Actinoalloteichus caeruleus]AUS80826.1 nitroreductase family deazaflavin-dependent oxidoreductase [Actinoalloteichus sp. AHMU CJ021]MCP2330242.1 deazaflavin-dependent oxidoreductase, nitroreductase family [Actinoalloteichus caeruleus DSM 43889]